MYKIIRYESFEQTCGSVDATKCWGQKSQTSGISKLGYDQEMD